MRPTPTAGDGDGIGQGAQIVLNQAGNVDHRLGRRGTDYFTIRSTPANGVVTFTDSYGEHLGTPTRPATLTIPQTLTLANANLLRLVQTVTDADGDSDTAAINLGSGVFTVQDDGSGCGCGAIRRLRRLCSTRARSPPNGDGHCVCDRELLGQLCGGELRHRWSWQRDLCAGSDRFERGVRAVCAGSGGHQRGDGDGIGQGAQIVLNQVGNDHHRPDRRDDLLHDQRRPGDAAR